MLLTHLKNQENNGSVKVKRFEKDGARPVECCFTFGLFLMSSLSCLPPFGGILEIDQDLLESSIPTAVDHTVLDFGCFLMFSLSMEICQIQSAKPRDNQTFCLPSRSPLRSTRERRQCSLGISVLTGKMRAPSDLFHLA